MQNVLREMGQLESTSNLTIKKAVHTRWLSHENALQTVRKLYVPIVRDLENAVAEGRDKKIKDGSGIPAGSLLKMMKTYSSIFFIHLLCDVCSSLASLTRLFERNDVDISIVEPKIQATISCLQKMKVKDGPYLTKAMTVANELFGLNNILFNKSQNMLWKYIVEIGSDIKLWGLLWSFPNTCGSCNIYEWYN